MITVKIKNKKDKEITAENIDEAMYKLAQEKKTSETKSKDTTKTVSDHSNLYESIKDKITKVNGYQKISKDEMNER
jgi:hypothetical protein